MPKKSTDILLTGRLWANTEDSKICDAEQVDGLVVFEGSGSNSFVQRSEHNKTFANAVGSIALNGGYKTNDDGSTTDGVIANGQWSLAGGKDTITYQRCSFSFGGGNKAGLTETEFNDRYSSGQDEHGKTYAESYSFATAEGVTTIATGYASHAENESTQATGHRSHASGQETYATGNRSFSTGYKTYAEGMNSFTMGESTTASGTGSFAQGYGGQASGNWSVKIGEHCKSTKIGSFSGGFSSESTGNYSFAFGGITNSFKNVTKATKPCAIALGCGAVASGDYQSTAIGLDVTASGAASLAMGWNSRATKLTSVAIGQECQSNGDRTMTVGWNNISNIANSFICGTFCSENTNALFVVGNGSANNSRSNAFTISGSKNNARVKVFRDTLVKDMSDKAKQVVIYEDVSNLLDLTFTVV